MHSDSYSTRYEEAGVDIRRGYQAVELMKKHVASTYTSGVVSDLGGFGGLFELDVKDTPNPVLVCGTDGVGTKLKIAFALDRHDTIGTVWRCVSTTSSAAGETAGFPGLYRLGASGSGKG